jgi:HD-GYP domain-containing protein (c-di-GMP phosphodiesterase class II)
MVRTLAEVCEAKDTYTRSHLDRTYQYAMMLTRRVAPELAEPGRDRLRLPAARHRQGRDPRGDPEQARAR